MAVCPMIKRKVMREQDDDISVDVLKVGMDPVGPLSLLARCTESLTFFIASLRYPAADVLSYHVGIAAAID